MDQDRCAEPGTHVRGTAGEVAELLVIRIAQLVTQLFIQTINPPVGIHEAQARHERLQSKVILLVYHYANGIPRTQNETRSARRHFMRFPTRELARNQVTLV